MGFMSGIRLGDNFKFDEISFKASIAEKGERIKHNAHCFLFARTDRIMLGLDKNKEFPIPLKAIILMHMRFDGYIGFPGGRVDKPVAGLPIDDAQDEILDAINREMVEEISYDAESFPITWDEYFMTNRKIHCFKWPNGEEGYEINHLHCFAKEIPESYIPVLEDDCIKNVRGYEYGREVFGNIRVPVYTLTDQVRGFPAFLKNNFIGSSRQQLLAGIARSGILSVEDINLAIERAGLN